MRRTAWVQEGQTTKQVTSFSGFSAIFEMHTLESLAIDLLRKQAGWVSKLQVTSELWASLVIFMLNKKLNISWRGKFILISQHVTQVFLRRWYIEVPFTMDFLSFLLLCVEAAEHLLLAGKHPDRLTHSLTRSSTGEMASVGQFGNALCC